MAEALAASTASTQRNERKLLVTIKPLGSVGSPALGLLQQALVASAQSDDQPPFGDMIASCIPARVSSFGSVTPRLWWSTNRIEPFAETSGL